LVTQVQGNHTSVTTLILNKVVENINVTIDEIGRPESNKEENKSMKQLLEEEDEKEEEEEYEDEDEENLTEVEEKVHQVSSKTPSKRVQKNHPLDQIIGNKDVGVETRRRISVHREQTHLELLSTIEPNYF
jgi:hypothetical protein